VLPLLQKNEDLQNEIQTLQICMDEKEFAIKSLKQEVDMF